MTPREQGPVAPGRCPAIGDVGAVQPQVDRGNVASDLRHRTPHPQLAGLRETVLRLKAGEPAPEGYELLRLIGHVQVARMDGSTSYDDMYVVAARKATEA